MGAHEYCNPLGPGCCASTAAFTETGELPKELLFDVRIVKRKRATYLDNGVLGSYSGPEVPFEEV
jgi:hypothetical protein